MNRNFCDYRQYSSDSLKKKTPAIYCKVGETFLCTTPGINENCPYSNFSCLRGRDRRNDEYAKSVFSSVAVTLDFHIRIDYWQKENCEYINSRW